MKLTDFLETMQQVNASKETIKLQQQFDSLRQELNKKLDSVLSFSLSENSEIYPLLKEQQDAMHDLKKSADKYFKSPNDENSDDLDSRLESSEKLTKVTRKLVKDKPEQEVKSLSDNGFLSLEFKDLANNLKQFTQNAASAVGKTGLPADARSNVVALGGPLAAITDELVKSGIVGTVAGSVKSLTEKFNPLDKEKKSFKEVTKTVEDVKSKVDESIKTDESNGDKLSDVKKSVDILDKDLKEKLDKLTEAEKTIVISNLGLSKEETPEVPDLPISKVEDLSKSLDSVGFNGKSSEGENLDNSTKMSDHYSLEIPPTETEVIPFEDAERAPFSNSVFAEPESGNPSNIVVPSFKEIDEKPEIQDAEIVNEEKENSSITLPSLGVGSFLKSNDEKSADSESEDDDLKSIRKGVELIVKLMTKKKKGKGDDSDLESEKGSSSSSGFSLSSLGQNNMMSGILSKLGNLGIIGGTVAAGAMLGKWTYDNVLGGNEKEAQLAKVRDANSLLKESRIEVQQATNGYSNDEIDNYLAKRSLSWDDSKKKLLYNWVNNSKTIKDNYKKNIKSDLYMKAMTAGLKRSTGESLTDEEKIALEESLRIKVDMLQGEAIRAPKEESQFTEEQFQTELKKRTKNVSASEKTKIKNQLIQKYFPSKYEKDLNSVSSSSSSSGGYSGNGMTKSEAYKRPSNGRVDERNAKLISEVGLGGGKTTAFEVGTVGTLETPNPYISVGGTTINWAQLSGVISSTEAGNKRPGESQDAFLNRMYSTDNGLGYLGRYQMGPEALQDSGYVKKKDLSKKTNAARAGFLEVDANWTGVDGVNSKEDFLKNRGAQEKAGRDFIEKKINSLNKMSVMIGGKEIPLMQAAYKMGFTPEQVVAGAHFQGSGAVKTLIQEEANYASGINKNLAMQRILSLKDGNGVHIKAVMNSKSIRDVGTNTLSAQGIAIPTSSGDGSYAKTVSSQMVLKNMAERENSLDIKNSTRTGYFDKSGLWAPSGDADFSSFEHGDILNLKSQFAAEQMGNKGAYDNDGNLQSITVDKKTLMPAQMVNGKFLNKDNIAKVDVNSPEFQYVMRAQAQGASYMKMPTKLEDIRDKNGTWLGYSNKDQAEFYNSYIDAAKKSKNVTYGELARESVKQGNKTNTSTLFVSKGDLPSFSKLNENKEGFNLDKVDFGEGYNPILNPALDYKYSSFGEGSLEDGDIQFEKGGPLDDLRGDWKRGESGEMEQVSVGEIPTRMTTDTNDMLKLKHWFNYKTIKDYLKSRNPEDAVYSSNGDSNGKETIDISRLIPSKPIGLNLESKSKIPLNMIKMLDLPVRQESPMVPTMKKLEEEEGFIKKEEIKKLLMKIRYRIT